MTTEVATRRRQVASPAPRWVGVFLAVCAVLFVPYVVQLAFFRPPRHVVAWVGLDVMELLALAATAWLAWTRSTWVAIAAAMAATLLVCDAWFDVATARDGRERLLAVAEAVLVEVPMAVFCLWIARHAERQRRR